MDVLIWLVALIIVGMNWLAIYYKKEKNTHFIVSGLSMMVGGPIIAFLLGGILVSYNHSDGSTGEGGAIAAVMVGWLILINCSFRIKFD